MATIYSFRSLESTVVSATVKIKVQAYITTARRVRCQLRYGQPVRHTCLLPQSSIQNQRSSHNEFILRKNTTIIQGYLIL